MNTTSYFSTKTYVVDTQKNRLNATVLLRTQNTRLNRGYGENHNFMLKILLNWSKLIVRAFFS